MLPLAVRSQQPCGGVSQAAGSVWNYLTSSKMPPMQCRSTVNFGLSRSKNRRLQVKGGRLARSLARIPLSTLRVFSGEEWDFSDSGNGIRNRLGQTCEPRQRLICVVL